MKKPLTISRRKFVGSASILALGTSLVSFNRVEKEFKSGIIPERKLWDEFNSEEKKLIAESERAKIIIEIEDMSCAERVLLATIRSFRKPDRLVSFAASFGGGIKRGDLCGMLTGGFMSIGFAADRLIKKKELRPAWITEKTNELWQWWEDLAPIHCSELRPLYAKNDRTVHSANFNRMLQRVALKLDELFVV